MICSIEFRADNSKTIVEIYVFGGYRRENPIPQLVFALVALGFIKTDGELDMWTTLGLGAMLVANIPIMWIYGPKAMRAYHEYIGKLKRGEFDN